MTQETALTILKTGASVFLTGEAGSGKTYVINLYTKYLREHDINFAVTASTGIAATHIGGMTIHSWSGIGIASELSDSEIGNITSNRYVTKRVKAAKVLIIDEISMLDGKTFRLVDFVCKKIKKSMQPFGGMQVIVVGDFFQLPPVTSAGKVTEFAFMSDSWQRLDPKICYLSEQYRQDDDNFLSVLGAIRRNEFDEDHFEIIQSRIIDVKKIPDNMTRLFPKNVDVDSINTRELNRLSGAYKKYVMAGRGTDMLVTTLKRGCLSPEELYLKEGAKVMFTKNNSGVGYVNGTLGTVVGFEALKQYPIVETTDGQKITVEPMDWSVSEGEVIQARISQLPLRLAWAITIHKSQGISLDAAVMDLSQAFEYGQGYVALSRVRTLAGIHLLGVNARAFEVHPEVLERDQLYREATLETDVYYQGIIEEEKEKLYQNFLIIAGGNLKAKEPGVAEKEKGTGFDEIRKSHPQAYVRWTKEDDEKLTELYQKNTPVKDLTEIFSRKRGAIVSRLKKLGLKEGK